MINHILPVYFLPSISTICVLLQVILSHTNSSRCITAANQTVTPHVPRLRMLLAANALLPRTLLQRVRNGDELFYSKSSTHQYVDPLIKRDEFTLSKEIQSDTLG